ncbi:MAG: hypothetical protein ABR609_03265 [Acidimicrobiia bacterium]
MTTNYDPKPGRWMLPLVVLAMVAFTYLFVRELPAAAGGDTDGSTTTTEVGATTTTVLDATTTTTPVVVDPETQAYLDTLASYQNRMTDFQTQLAAANSGWDANPRTITFDQAEAAFIAVVEGVSALASEAAELVPPGPLAEGHAAVATAAQQAADAAIAALDGLRAPSPDTGETRRNAVAAFDTAVAAFGQAIADIIPGG